MVFEQKVGGIDTFRKRELFVRYTKQEQSKNCYHIVSTIITTPYFH